jgi:hypothetical protein
LAKQKSSNHFPNDEAAARLIYLALLNINASGRCRRGSEGANESVCHLLPRSLCGVIRPKQKTRAHLHQSSPTTFPVLKTMPPSRD